jgi:hypothetical protein
MMKTYMISKIIMQFLLQLLYKDKFRIYKKNVLDLEVKI